MGAGAVGHIVVDAHGERVGLLEDHADLLSESCDVHSGGVDILAVKGHGALDAHAGD